MIAMSYGPIELLMIDFPGSKFSGEIMPALTELVESGTIRIIDILIVRKDADGSVTDMELSDLVDAESAAFEPLIDELAGLLTHDDAQHLAASMPMDSTAGIMLFENVWAKRFADAVVNAHGEVVINERIPRVVVDELLAAHAGMAD